MSCSSSAASGPSAEHPCYSAEGRHRYARLHLAVAPACNIQCNYCNRRFDCSNESRPGVTSGLLTPAQAAERVAMVKARMPNLTVVGIAGPGDPLANAARTLDTLKRVRDFDPSLLLCVSTNGLALAPLAGKLAELGVNHLTITLNTLDPAIGERLYPWIYYANRRWQGRRAAQLMVDAQLDGLAAAVAAGMQVKINSVVIPGITDHGLTDVAEAARQHGAVLHNLMPLISRPEHGTYFGLSGQREPTAAELESCRERLRPLLPLMEHCQQCRADAVGTLGDLPAPSPSRRVAVASRDGRLVDWHLGHATAFDIYELDGEQAHHIERRPLPAYCSGSSECGDDDRGQRLLQAVTDCQTVVACRVGESPRQMLAAAGIQVDTDHAWQTVVATLAHLQPAKAASACRSA